MVCDPPAGSAFNRCAWPRRPGLCSHHTGPGKGPRHLQTFRPCPWHLGATEKLCRIMASLLEGGQLPQEQPESQEDRVAPSSPPVPPRLPASDCPLAQASSGLPLDSSLPVATCFHCSAVTWALRRHCPAPSLPPRFSHHLPPLTCCVISMIYFLRRQRFCLVWFRVLSSRSPDAPQTFPVTGPAFEGFSLTFLTQAKGR